MAQHYETASSGEGQFSSKEAEIFCDVASRFGLSLLRWGDYANAVSAFELSSKIAQNYLGADPARIARSQVNLGDVFCELGNLPKAIQFADQALAWRTRKADETGNVGAQSSEWRRLTIAQKIRTVIAYRAGQVVDGVQRAMRLVEDRRAKLPPESLNTASAYAVLGEALLEAGHPHEARQNITEADAIQIDRLPPTSYSIQNDLLLLSRVELTLGHPAEAVKLLEGSPILTSWFAERVSFRLSYEASRYYALGLAESLGPDQGISALEAGITELTGRYDLLPTDPLVQRYQRGLAQIFLYSGDAPRAQSILAEIDEYETERGKSCLSAHATTLLLLARSSINMRDRPAAQNYLRRLNDLVSDGMDASHPTIMEGYYEEAMLHLAYGELSRSRDLLAVLLDDKVLAHGRTALGEGHRLLVAARRQAPGVGLTVRQTDEDKLWSE
jgi:tetratricopeptide (TPR) repeat protein